MSEEVSLDTKEWISEFQKIREWSMQRFLARIKVVNELFTVMSIPEGETGTIPKLMNSKLIVILKKSVPKSWKNK